MIFYLKKYLYTLKQHPPLLCPKECWLDLSLQKLLYFDLKFLSIFSADLASNFIGLRIAELRKKENKIKNNAIAAIQSKMIKLGSNVKSKIHDDLTGHVVVYQPLNNYAVIMTDIIDYEMMTVECFLSDLELA